MSRAQLVIVGLLLGATVLAVSEYRSNTALRVQNERLRQKLAQLASDNESLSKRLASTRPAPMLRLPAPSLQTLTSSASADETSGTNLIALLVHGGEVPALTADQLKGFLNENRRNATSLLAAYRTSKDPALLREAMERYPGDPQVAFEAALNKDASLAERRQWLDAFKKAAPDNPLPAYLSALDRFKAGQTDAAVQDLIDASGRPRFADYTLQRIQADAEAFRAAGYSEGDAKMAATWGVTLPQLSEFQILAKDIVGLAASYRNAGDEPSAQAALQMAIGLGQQLDGSTGSCVPLVTRLVGLAAQRTALEAMDSASPYGDGTVQDQLAALNDRRQSLGDMVKHSTPLQDQMTPMDWLNYNDRTLTFGEENAIAWLMNKYGQK